MNPRIQVEHTVTEMVTGLDLVRAQILVAQGEKLHEKPLDFPEQDKVPLYGAALQCRVTTEDPEKNFARITGRFRRIDPQPALEFGLMAARLIQVLCLPRITIRSWSK